MTDITFIKDTTIIIVILIFLFQIANTIMFIMLLCKNETDKNNTNTEIQNESTKRTNKTNTRSINNHERRSK